MRVHVLDRFRLPLVRLQDLQKLLVYFWFVLEAILIFELAEQYFTRKFVDRKRFVFRVVSS